MSLVADRSKAVVGSLLIVLFTVSHDVCVIVCLVPVL